MYDFIVVSGKVEEIDRWNSGCSLLSWQTHTSFTTSQSYHGAIPPNQDMAFDIGAFAGSTASLKTMRSVC